LTGNTTPGKLTQRLTVDIDKCTGCECCALACSFAKTGAYNVDSGCISVLKFDESGVDCPVICQQCAEPRCVEACPRHALSKQSSSGLVILDDAFCDGCGICLTACPYGAIGPAPAGDEKRRILKCDLCGGHPACVEWCETGALSLTDKSENVPLNNSSINVLMAVKRFEIDHQTKLWKLRLGGQSLKKSKRKA